MYRDDECAVCGAALPPDHSYYRERAAQVDERLHDIGARLDAGVLRATTTTSSQPRRPT